MSRLNKLRKNFGIMKTTIDKNEGLALKIKFFFLIINFLKLWKYMLIFSYLVWNI